LGLVVFVLSLLPALNLAAFPPEHLVHDRYLYLPLLGALMMLIPTTAELIARGRPAGRAEAMVLAAAGVVAVPLALQTVVYSRVWFAEDALWERAVETDPTSASSWMQHAVMLRRAGRTQEAARALDRSIEIAPMPPAFIERSDLLLAAGRAEEAEADLRRVMAAQPGNPLPYERLAAMEQGRGRLAESEALLRAGREAAPGQACSFSANLGVVLYLQGRREEAGVELEQAASLADRDLSPVCRTGVFHLGSLRAAQGDAAGARAAWSRYLALTEGFTDATSTRLRAETARMLGTR
jgi:tetratricopeptide (TPR) repeat protein